MEYITKDGLKKRGWTDSLINRFLPEPDKRETNPDNSRWHKMCLYSIERVRSIEDRSREFYEAKKKIRKRGKEQ